MKAVTQRITETDAKQLLQVTEFRQGLIEGFKRGHEKGMVEGEKQSFRQITQFLTLTLKQLDAEGKSLAEAIEFIN